ncbi:hypothetical protein Tco_0540427 [Tanacetum coccineum]
MVFNSLCLTDIKNLLVQKQTASGKDFSNPFMVDNLPKIVWFSTHLASQLSIHLVVYNEELAIPEQTATGKGISNSLVAGQMATGKESSNLFMAGSLLKTIHFCDSLQSDEDRSLMNAKSEVYLHCKRLQMRWQETRTTRFQTAIRSEEVFGYILLVIKKLLMKKLDD